MSISSASELLIGYLEHNAQQLLKIEHTSAQTTGTIARIFDDAPVLVVVEIL